MTQIPIKVQPKLMAPRINLGNERVLNSDRLEDSRTVAEAQIPRDSVPHAFGPR